SAPVSEVPPLVRCSRIRRGTGLRRSRRNRLEKCVMAKFLFIYRESTEHRAKPSPEEMQALQQAWYAWMQKYSSAIVGGDGLKPSGRIIKAGVVSDGPYVEAKEVIASFSMIQADNYDCAVAIARACPGQDTGKDCHTIEIRELGGYA